MTTLFDQAPYQRHSPSSRDGARQVARGGKAASIRATVLAWFNERGRQGGTDDFERLDALARLREVFSSFDGAHVLDGLEAPETVLEAAQTLVDDALETSKKP